MVRASAPTRIDLAGGTIDIWPVCYALDRPALTVNLAIDIRVEVDAEATDDGFLEVVSLDRGEEVRLPVDRIEHGRLGLATRHAAWFGAGDGLRIRTRSAAPPQSGLGGSSALGVALAGALGKLRDRPWDLTLVQNIETALLGFPTGYQDYRPAFHGGVNALAAVPEGVRVDRIDGGEEFLAAHLLLADTRIAHESGMNNWEVTKRFLDGDAMVRRAMNSINDCARRLRDALAARDVDGFAAALNDEWAERRRLAPVVSNTRIESMIAAARDAGALGAKICGAGGGGCMVVVARNAARDAVREALERTGGAVLDFRPDADGLTVA